MGLEEEALRELLSEQEFDNLKRCITGELDLYVDCKKLHSKLFDYYTEEMPYGTAKARTGDPDVWIIKRVEEALKADDPFVRRVRMADRVRNALRGGLMKKRR